jgi:dCMP deaminase
MSKDSYYLRIAQAVASESKCLSRQIGAILVKDKSIISTGYNGPPRGVPHCDERYTCDAYLMESLEKINGPRVYDPKVCPRRAMGFQSGEGLHFCIASHAEVNCINNAARQGIATYGSSMYLSCEILPCKSCLCEIINAGIQEVVVVEYNPYDRTSLFLIQHSGLRIRTYSASG